MSPLLFEMDDGQGGWIDLGTLTPDLPAASVSDNPAEGGRELIVFECRSSRLAVISWSRGGADWAREDGMREATLLDGLEERVRLAPGDEHRMVLRTDGMAVAAQVRWRMT